jgi:hypothetical protein
VRRNGRKGGSLSVGGVRDGRRVAGVEAGLFSRTPSSYPSLPALPTAQSPCSLSTTTTPPRSSPWRRSSSWGPAWPSGSGSRGPVSPPRPSRDPCAPGGRFRRRSPSFWAARAIPPEGGPAPGWVPSGPPSSPPCSSTGAGCTSSGTSGSSGSSGTTWKIPWVMGGSCCSTSWRGWWPPGATSHRRLRLPSLWWGHREPSAPSWGPTSSSIPTPGSTPFSSSSSSSGSSPSRPGSSSSTGSSSRWPHPRSPLRRGPGEWPSGPTSGGSLRGWPW